MKRHCKFTFITIIVLSVLMILCSCMSLADDEKPTRFSLSHEQSSSTNKGMLFGTVNYGSGFYFPSTNDILDISVLKTDAITGFVTEISHLRIRNLLKFPIQFTLWYDKADVGDSDSCSLIVTLLVDNVIKSQGISLLTKQNQEFDEASITLIAV